MPIADFKVDAQAQALPLTEETFESFISEPGPPALVDFWAPWCAPCLLMTPIFDELAQEMRGKLRVAKVNIQDCPGLLDRVIDGPALGIPVLVLYGEGEEMLRISGACEKEKLLDIIVPFL